MKIRFKNTFNLLLLVAGLGLFSARPLAAQTFFTLYSFSALNQDSFSGVYTNSDGDFPFAGLILSGNTLYGTTVYGGTGQSCCFSAGDGVVFAIHTDGTGFTVLHTFSATAGDEVNSDGAFPEGRLVLSGDTLYGTTPLGGPAGQGTIFAVNTNGTGFTVLYSFSALDYSNSPAVNGDGAAPIGGLTLSGDTLYGTTSRGGSGGGGTVFAIKTDGMGFQTVYSFPTTGAGFSWAGLVLSGKTLYGTTRDGGTGGAGTVFALNADGTGFTTLHNFTSTPNGTNADGAHPYSTLALSDGTLYGTTDEGGSGFLGTVFALQTDGSGFRTLHSFSATSGSSGAYGTNSDGADSYAGVILSGDTLYGAAHSGGAAGYGTAFKLRTDGTGFSVLHTFGEGAIFDSAPDGDLLFFGNTLYGATRGGSFGSSEIFSIALPVIPPQLTLVAGGRNVVLAWPTNTGGFDYSGYTLQSSTNLGPAAAWVTNSVQPVVANGKFMVTNPISGAKQFYRLAQ